MVQEMSFKDKIAQINPQNSYCFISLEWIIVIEMFIVSDQEIRQQMNIC